ncbi:MAG: esterase-like activity of phytase family protein [Microcystaceae cyanobacterium]
MFKFSQLSLLTLVSLGTIITYPMSSAYAVTITSTNQTPFLLNGGSELSGITYVSDDLFYAVGDSANAFFPLNIAVDTNSGMITSAQVGNAIDITGVDHEGISYNSLNNSVFVVSEGDSIIREHSVENGTELNTIATPAVYQNIRPNLGLESLTGLRDGTSLWTANEEALTIDGDRGTIVGNRTLVRLQEFDETFNPMGQWAYEVESPTPPFIQSNGVSDLLLLPNGELLVLEREASMGVFGFQHRLFSVNFEGATDISALTGGLAGENFISVNKELLWQDTFMISNFEGLTLGPQLTNGDYSLLLVSDNGSGLSNSLLSLRISGLEESVSVPESSSILPFLALILGFFPKLPHRLFDICFKAYS